MHTKTKKTYPSQSSCNPLDAIIVSHVHKTTRPLQKFRGAKPTQQIASSNEASPTFGHANKNLIHFFRNWFLIRSITAINTEKFAFA